MTDDSDVDQSAGASGVIDRTAESNGMSTIDPLVNTNNILTAAAELAIVKAGFIKPKEGGEPALVPHSTRSLSSRASLLRAARITSGPAELENKEAGLTTHNSE